MYRVILHYSVIVAPLMSSIKYVRNSRSFFTKARFTVEVKCTLSTSGALLVINSISSSYA